MTKTIDIEAQPVKNQVGKVQQYQYTDLEAKIKYWAGVAALYIIVGVAIDIFLKSSLITTMYWITPLLVIIVYAYFKIKKNWNKIMEAI